MQGQGYKNLYIRKKNQQKINQTEILNHRTWLKKSPDWLANDKKAF